MHVKPISSTFNVTTLSSDIDTPCQLFKVVFGVQPNSTPFIICKFNKIIVSFNSLISKYKWILSLVVTLDKIQLFVNSIISLWSFFKNKLCANKFNPKLLDIQCLISSIVWFLKKEIFICGYPWIGV